MAHIVHVVEALGGGVLAMVSVLVSGQVHDGHRVTLVASLNRPDLPANWRLSMPSEMNLVVLPMTREIRLTKDLAVMFRLRALLRLDKPDVVHLHSSKAGALGRMATCGLRIATVYQPHGLSFLRRDVALPKRMIFKAIEWCLARLGGTVIACSEGERDALISVAHRGKLALVCNGISFTDLPEKRHLAKARPLIGTCSRICPQKGPEFFSIVAKALGGRADFLWIGDGPDSEKEVVLDAAVNVTGWQTRQESLLHMARLDVYIQTSLWEGMPISVIEAMAIGIPVVATDILGNRDLLGEYPEALVSTPAEMISKLTDLIDDSEGRSRIGQILRGIAGDRFSSNAMLEGHYRVYKDCYDANARANRGKPKLSQNTGPWT